MQSLRFFLIVTSAAYGEQGSSSALRLAQQIARSEHQLSAVFFYQQGVLNACSTLQPASDELHIVRQWQQLGDDAQCELLVCSAAAARRGIFGKQDAQTANLSITMAAPFKEAGLAEMAMLMQQADRVVRL